MREADLLSNYVRDRSNAAFTTLVERHLNLVYFVARRHVRDAAAAEDVAQAVFVELARRAPQIKPGTPLVAWLHLVARRTALNAVRSEQRRHAHEAAAASLETMNPPPPPWTDVEPLLDEAVESLAEPDRTAILLRYFENKSLRDVGAALGTSDDAAQKRVSRAVDALRAFFVRRGVAVSAAGLAADLATHTLHAAPAGLGATISTAATLTGVTTAATFETSRVIVMTTLQKTAIAAAFVVAGGTGLYQASLAARQADELRTLRAQNELAAAKSRALANARTATATRLKTVEEQIDARLASARTSSADDAALARQLTAWLGRVDRLKRFFVERPEHNIPELQTLTDTAWFGAAAEPIESEEALRKAIAQLRNTAETRFTPALGRALRDYLKAHDDVLPASSHDLAPFCDPPIDRAILDRYEALHTGRLANVPAAERRAIMSLRSPIDPEFDSLPRFGPDIHGNASAVGVNFTQAMERFTAAHPGVRPTTAAQLRPYLKWALRDEAVQNILDRFPPKSP